MTFSRIGPSVLHGPHHSAQRSTTTGTVIDRSITAVANVASVTSVTTDSITAARVDGSQALLASSNMNEDVSGSTNPASRRGWANTLGPPRRLTFELIAGGRSNLTYRVVDARGHGLRAATPADAVTCCPTAHDMVREHTVISALCPLGVPVADRLGPCARRGGQRTALLRHGVRRRRDPARPRPARKRPLTRRFAVVDRRRILAVTLAHLHDVDVDAAGLGGLARHDGYIERQLRRWRTQYEQMRVEGVDHGGLIEDVGDELSAQIPAQQRVSVVHGDYRLDNTVLDDAGACARSSTGRSARSATRSPTSGLLMVYWADPADATGRSQGSRPPRRTGFASSRPGRKAYAVALVLDSARVAYYQAFGYWKLACIMQGVFARYSAGAAGGDQGRVAITRPIS